MMAPKKRKLSYKLPLDVDTLQKLALKLVGEEMAVSLTDQHKLCGSSGVWRTARGTLTMKFVFKTKKGNNIIWTIRNVPIPDLSEVRA